MGLSRLIKSFLALAITVGLGSASPSWAQNSVTTPTTTLQNDFVVTGNFWPQGNETLTGNLSVGGTSTFTGATTFTVPLLSGSIDPTVIQHVSVPLTAANIAACYATPIQLIAAGGTGTNILVHKVMLTMNATSTAFTGGTAVEFQLGNTAHGAGTLTTASIANTVVDATGPSTTYTTVIPVSYTSLSATGLFISVTGSTFTGGTGTAVVDVWYSLK